MGKRNQCKKKKFGEKTQKKTLGDEVQNGRIVKLLFSNQNLGAWTRLIRPWGGTGIGFLFIPLCKFGCHKRITFQRIAECLVAYRENPYFFYSRINSTNSPALSAGKLSEPKLMSNVGRMRELMCA
jgi:hypothetical protein